MHFTKSIYSGLGVSSLILAGILNTAQAADLDLPSSCQDVYATNYKHDDQALQWNDSVHNLSSLLNDNGNNLVTPVSFGDVNGDGHNDALVYCNDGAWLGLGDNNGHFGPLEKVDSGYGNPRWGFHDVRKLADVTGDGLADIVGYGYNVIWLAVGLGDGSFAPPIYPTRAFTRAYGWDIKNDTRRYVVDINGDNMADLVGFYEDGIVDIALASGNGYFEPERRVHKNFHISGYQWTGASTERFLEDVNGDGLLDLVAQDISQAGEETSKLVSLNLGNGSFAKPNYEGGSVDNNNGPVIGAFNVSHKVLYVMERFEFSWATSYADSCDLRSSASNSQVMPTRKGTSVATNGSWGMRWSQRGNYSVWLVCEGTDRSGQTNRPIVTVSPRIDVVVSVQNQLPIVNISSWNYDNIRKVATINYSSQFADRCSAGGSNLSTSGTYRTSVRSLPAVITITCYNQYGNGSDTEVIRLGSGKGDFPFRDIGTVRQFEM